MANLMNRNTTFEDLFDFRRDFDHMFNRLLSGRHGWQGLQGRQRGESSMASFTPAIEAYVDQENKRFVCRVALAGVDPKDVDIEVNGRLLTISGEHEFSNEQNESGLVHTEFAYGEFERDIELPDGVDAQKITAESRNGILEIAAPIAASSLPRRVEIKSVEQEPKRIGAAAGSSNR